MREDGSLNNWNNNMWSMSPCKNLRGLKALIAAAPNETSMSTTTTTSTAAATAVDEIINDYELANRKAEEAAARRNQAAEWLRQMDQGAWRTLSKEPSEEEFCLALRNGLILCNVLNKVNPGAVPKVVDNPVPTSLLSSAEGAAQSAFQYFENTRNFLVALGNMKLLTFEASDLEKGGSSNKVVDCILCLKGYYEWKQSGGIGVWRYGGTIRITSFPKECSSSSVGSETTEESSIDDYELEQLSQFLHVSSTVSSEESRAAKCLSLLFDQFGIRILQAYLSQRHGVVDDSSLNSMVIDGVIRKVVKEFSALLVSQGIQLGLLLKKLLKSDTASISVEEFLKATSDYMRERNALAFKNSSDFCICGGRRVITQRTNNLDSRSSEITNHQQQQLAELQSAFQETKLEVQKVRCDWKEEVSKLEDHIKGLEVASSSYHKVLEENRNLYNLVQDLKGTIRVYCRVRPFLSGKSDRQSTVDYIGENGNIMILHPHRHGRDARKMFSFNKVYGTNVTQQQIYADTQPLIRSVLDGFNVCIFAYGQTGSGKTYTMSGPDLSMQETWGVNYRALGDLFEISRSRADMVEYDIEVQMIEIYNEQVRDLLVIDGSTRRLDIRNNSQLNGLNVPDASLVRVNCTQDVLDLMRIGHKNRAVGATALNERSSRSHSILTVHVRGRELLSGTILKGCLHLVDLAGSERVDKSEAVGERLREAQHINRSLSALGDVISSLAQKSTHIPYRNSKLTQVLQDSLGGQAKTLMFVHISPEIDAIGETISTLKFAERVGSIELGAARSNKETTEIRDLKEEISNLKMAVEKKEAELEQLKSTNVRSTPEPHKARAVSPMRMPKFGTNGTPKLETEARSCSSGKQRRSRIQSSYNDKEMIPKMPQITEERLRSSSQQRSQSPPVRRSISTDRGTLVKSRLKPETGDDPPIRKLQFPVRASINKSSATLPIIPPVDKNLKSDSQMQEHTQHEINNSSDVLYSLQKSNAKRTHIDHENEKSNKPVLGVRQSVIGQSKVENRSKTKNQLPLSRAQKPDITPALFTDTVTGSKMEEARKSDFSEPENELDLIGSSPANNNNLKVKKLIRQNNSLKSSQNLEPSFHGGLAQTAESGKLESKLPTSVTARNQKESSNTTMPEFRRSRSSPRGTFFALP